MTNDNEIWVFLSHSNKDYEKVRQVRNLLEEQKFRPLMFFLCCLDDDQEIDNLIKREIDHRTRFIYCESENSKESKWVQEEVKYIKSKDRVFETINLDLPIMEINKQLDTFRKKANIFISYQRDDTKLAKAIYNRLRKYEFNVWIASENIQNGGLFSRQIEDAILNAVNNGYVIALLNERILNPQGWTRADLTKALQESVHPERTIIPVVQDSSLWNKLSNDLGLQSLHSINEIDSSVVEPTKRCDYIVNEFIMRVLPPGAILSHAQNFEKGFYGYKDLEEAKKLYSLCFKIAEKQEKLGSSAGDGVLGYCYEHGYGTEKNLGMAIDYYREAAKYFPNYQADYKRVYEQLYGHEMKANSDSVGLWTTIKRLWKKSTV